MTQYEPRPKKLTRTYNCKCGHSYFDHDWFANPISILEFFTFKPHAGKCEKCMCPRFKQDEYLD